MSPEGPSLPSHGQSSPSRQQGPSSPATPKNERREKTWNSGPNPHGPWTRPEPAFLPGVAGQDMGGDGGLFGRLLWPARSNFGSFIQDHAVSSWLAFVANTPSIQGCKTTSRPATTEKLEMRNACKHGFTCFWGLSRRYARLNANWSGGRTSFGNSFVELELRLGIM